MRNLGLFILSLVLLTSCSENPTVEPQAEKPVEVKAKPKQKVLPEVPKLQRKWQVGLLIMDGVYNTELTAPMDIFHHTKFRSDTAMEVFTIAKSKAVVTSFEGLKIVPDYSYTEGDYPPIDVLVVPSAEHHLDSDLEDEALLEFVRKTSAGAQYVTSQLRWGFCVGESGCIRWS